MMGSARKLVLAIGVASGIVLSLPAAGATFALFQLRPDFGGATAPDPINEGIFNPSGLIQRQAGGATGRAEVREGVLKAFASAQGADPFFARTRVELTDTLRFTTGGGPAQDVRADIELVFDRALSSGNSLVRQDSGYAIAALGFGLSPKALQYTETFRAPLTGPCATQFCAPALETQSSGDLAFEWLTPSTLKITLPTLANTDLELSLSLEVIAYAGFDAVNGSQSWIANAANSLYWGGVRRVVDEADQVLDFGVTSLSGTDYTQSFAPIPEPSAWLLMALGLAGLAALRRRRA